MAKQKGKKGRKKKSKKQFVRADHLSGFHFEPVKQRSPSPTNHQTRRYTKIREFDKEEFVKSAFHFFLVPKSDLPTTSNASVPWNQVVAVQFTSYEPYSCPICLSSPPVSARVTACGHVFCYQCIYHHFHVTEDAKCPLCSEGLAMNNLRICHYKQLTQKKIGDPIRLILHDRDGIYLTPRKNETTISHDFDNLDLNGTPAKKDDVVNYNRFTVFTLDEFNQLFDSELQLLKQSLRQAI
eukprot:UN34429